MPPRKVPHIQAFALALTMLASCQAFDRSSEPGVIAFTSRRDGWFSVYTVRPDGTDLHKLRDIVRSEAAGKSSFLDILGQPAWSADGSRIAFTCPFRGQSAICVANGDGSDPVVLTPTPAGPHRYPTWSPDGRIAFSRFVDESHAYIVVANGNGTGVRELTTGNLDVGPTWSPDGSRIAFVRERAGQSDIYVMGDDGSDMHPITDTSTSEGMLAWSPDGRRIAYVIGSPTQDIHVIDTDGSNSRNLTRSSGPEAWPTWSPDGTQLAFMCGPGAGICVMNAQGSGRRQIVGSPYLNMQPSWHPG